MSDPKNRLAESMVAVGTAISRLLADTAGCDVAFIVIAAPVTNPDNGLMFANTRPGDMESALETVLQSIRKARQQQTTFVPPNPSTRKQ